MTDPKPNDLTRSMPVPVVARLRNLLTSRYGILYLFAGLYLMRGFVIRTALAVYSEAMLDVGLGTYLRIASVGVLLDLVACGWILLPAVLYLTVAPKRWLSSLPHRLMATGCLLIAVGVLFFGAASEWLFWEEFESRFNFIAVDYLIYTTEVVDNIVESYSVPLILLGVGVLTLLVGLIFSRLIRLSVWNPRTHWNRALPLAGFLIVPICGRLIVEWAGTSISDNRYANELAKNGEYSLVGAFFGNVLDYGENYESLPDQTVFKRVRELLSTPDSQFVSTDVHDLTRSVDPPGDFRPYNVVLVTIESLSADLVGAYGDDKGLTPKMDALAKDSLLFTNVFATGSRTVRGLEAISLSIPPTPGRSILKRPQHANLHTIGHVFREHGYKTQFAYGGYGYFDGMNTFFEHNGYEIVDRSDISAEQTRFSNAWGVCDEDLYACVVRECDKSDAEKKPFFIHVMTTSNHRPYTYPDVIDIPSGTGRYGAVKYSDHAIGSLIEEAKTKPWFSNTVFVFIADHCASSAGKRQLELQKHHIPMLIYAPGIVTPGVIEDLGSQVDLGPTLFSLLNMDVRAPFYGQDLLSPGNRRAYVGNYQCLGLFNGDRMVVLAPKREHSVYKVGEDNAQVETASDGPLLHDGISLYQSACSLYGSGLLELK